MDKVVLIFENKESEKCLLECHDEQHSTDRGHSPHSPPAPGRQTVWGEWTLRGATSILSAACLELQSRPALPSPCYSSVSQHTLYSRDVSMHCLQCHIFSNLLSGYLDLNTGFVILSLRCCIFRTFRKFSSSWTKFVNLFIFFLLKTGLSFLLILMTKTPLLTVWVSVIKLSLAPSSSIPEANSCLVSDNPLNPNLARISSNRAWLFTPWLLIWNEIFYENKRKKNKQ